MKPSIGRIVHVRVGGTDEDPMLRAGIVTRVFGADRCHVHLFLDYRDEHYTFPPSIVREGGQTWALSASEGTGEGQWRWPPRT